MASMKLVMPEYSTDVKADLYQKVRNLGVAFEGLGFERSMLTESEMNNHLYLLNGSVATFHTFVTGMVLSNKELSFEIAFEAGSRSEDFNAPNESLKTVYMATRDLPGGSWSSKIKVGGTSVKDDCYGGETVFDLDTSDNTLSVFADYTTYKRDQDGGKYSDFSGVDTSVDFIGGPVSLSKVVLTVEPETVRREVVVPGPWPKPATMILMPGNPSCSFELDSGAITSITSTGEGHDELSIDIAPESEDTVTATLTPNESLESVSITNLPAGSRTLILDESSTPSSLVTEYLAPDQPDVYELNVEVLSGDYSVKVSEEGFEPQTFSIPSLPYTLDYSDESGELAALETTDGTSGGDDIPTADLNRDLDEVMFYVRDDKGYPIQSNVKLRVKDGLDVSHKDLDSVFQMNSEAELSLYIEREYATDIHTGPIDLSSEDFSEPINLWDYVKTEFEDQGYEWRTIEYDAAYATKDFELNLKRTLGTDTIGKGPLSFWTAASDYCEIMIESVSGASLTMRVNIASSTNGDVLNINRYLKELYPTVAETGEQATVASGVSDSDSDSVSGNWTSLAAAAGVGFIVGLMN